MTNAVSTLAPRARHRMQPPERPDRVTQYALDVVAGRIVTGQLVRRACERHLADLATGAQRGLHFDVAAASIVVLVANSTPTVNAGSQVNVVTPAGEANRTTTV